MKNPAFRKLSFVLVIISVFVSLLILGCSTSSTTPATSAVTSLAIASTTPVVTTTSAPASTVKPAENVTTTTSPVPVLTTTQTATPVTGQSKYGGDLSIIGMGLPSENLGYIATAVPRWNPTVPSPCVETLINWTNEGLFAPNLATSWKWSADHLSLTLTLRKGVKFQDGSDFNAQAVKFLLDLVRTSDRTELRGAANIDLIDDYTVKINVKAYDALLVANLATVAGAMVSPTAIEKYGKEYNIQHPVGTGPFSIVSYERDVHVKYQKFNGYWQQGKPYLDKIQYLLVADALTARAAFLSGAGQIFGVMGAADAVDLVKRGNFNIVKNLKLLVTLSPDGSNKDSPFYNVKVRQAVAYAIDTKSIINAIGSGYLVQTNQPSAPGIWSYNPDVAGYPYNPQKAKDLLKEAGYPSGFKTTLYYPTGYTDIINYVTAAQAQLGAVGINATLQAMAPTGFTNMITKGWQNGIVASTPSTGTNYSPLRTILNNFSTIGTNYISLYHPEAVESLLKQALVEPDQDKLTKTMQQINKMLIDDYCATIPCFGMYNIWATTPEVKSAGWLTGEDWSLSAGDAYFSK
jgi:peptide/nickel transport system substrate-binding protein